MPAFAARFALGEMAEALLLASARVQPKVLENAGYEYRTPSLDKSIRAALDETL
jgi:NAD dependent epimerase/dehydratase family enzyme